MNAILDQEPLMLRGIPKDRQDVLLDIKPLLSLLTVKIWPLIDKNDINRIKKFASISMLLLIKADMQDYLQEKLKKIMVAFGFQSVYYTYLNNFYQSGVIKRIGGGQLLEILDYYKTNQSQQKRLLFHAFSLGGLQDYAIQKSLGFNFFYVNAYFGREWVPEMSLLLLNNLMSRIICLDMDKNITPQEKSERISEEMRKIFWYIYQVVIADNIIHGNYGPNHAHWCVLNWFLDFKIAQELIKLDFKTYLIGLEFLLHKYLGRELSKIKVPIESVDIDEYEKNRRKGVLSKESNKYLCYFIDCIYTLS